MRKWVILGAFSIMTAVLLLLGKTALDPADFSGEWRSADSQLTYQFSEGIIYCPEHTVSLGDGSAISGTYMFTKDSVILFAVGIDGLESVRELYLVENDEQVLLCERKDGSGRVYFIRDDNQ